MCPSDSETASDSTVSTVSNKTLGRVTSGRLTLVDLAGSERLTIDERSNKQAKQTGNINKSLGKSVRVRVLSYSLSLSSGLSVCHSRLVDRH